MTFFNSTRFACLNACLFHTFPLNHRLFAIVTAPLHCYRRYHASRPQFVGRSQGRTSPWRDGPPRPLRGPNARLSASLWGAIPRRAADETKLPPRGTMGRRTFFARGGCFPAGVFTSCSSLFCCIVAASVAVPDLVEFVEVEVPEGVHKIKDPALPVNVVSSMLSRTPRRHRKTSKNKDLATLGSPSPHPSLSAAISMVNFTI